MAQPSPSDVHVDSILTNISIAYLQQQKNYIAPRVFPVIPVDKQGDKYFTYDRNDFLRDEVKKRAPNTESEGSGYGQSTDNYYADVWAFHKDVSDQVIENSDAPLNPEADAARFVVQKFLTKMDLQWVADYFTTSVWGTDATPTILWDDAASDPITDVDTGKRTILVSTGFDPNTLVLGYDVWRQLKNHPDIVDRYKHTTADTVTPEMVARLFEVDRILVSKSVYASNVEGETAAYGFTAGKHALLCYVPPSPSLLTPAAGYTFTWTGVSDGAGSQIATVRIPMPTKRSVRVESQMAWDNKVVATALGYFFNSAVS